MVVNLVQFGVARLSGRKDGHPNRPATPINFRTTIIGDSVMKKIQLGNNRGVALIDDEDFALVSQHKWYLLDQGNRRYAIAHTKKVGNCSTIRMHRLIMGFPENVCVDHANHDTLDNRKQNLRVCTHAQNMRNRKMGKNNTSGYKGVSRHTPARKWMAHIRMNRKLIHLGLFKSEKDAARAYDKKAKELHGKFAYLNFPERA